ncbi:CarD family transcriptional regulator [Candidatus Phycosocius bacilliformis]|nr:CarD family transcriptional regulator [Candidatus Phycosocius bacilliformis]
MSDVKKTTTFQIGDHVVYPAHGVGRITGIESQTVAGMSLEVFVIAFDQDKMTLRVPTSKVKTGGLRALSGPAIMDDALKTLTGRARIKRAMWSRRAQEYEAKINSGDLISIAEVVRDLHRATDQPEQSYSERQLYESALDRMAREVAAIESVNREEAIKKLTGTLASRAA